MRQKEARKPGTLAFRSRRQDFPVKKTSQKISLLLSTLYNQGSIADLGKPDMAEFYNSTKLEWTSYARAKLVFTNMSELWTRLIRCMPHSQHPAN